jgi:hypothetical protein
LQFRVRCGRADIMEISRLAMALRGWMTEIVESTSHKWQAPNQYRLAQVTTTRGASRNALYKGILRDL